MDERDIKILYQEREKICGLIEERRKEIVRLDEKITDLEEQILNTIEEKQQLVLLIQTIYRNLKSIDEDLTEAGAL